MPETAIKSNEREAARLYERGVAAARGGQRRVAVGLLSRAVQLDPRHELAWLWLSGVLDTPEEIAFCLRSVLAINPHNERARQGLAWLEQRGQIAAQPAPPAIAPTLPEPAPDAERAAHRERESWWVRWRRERRDMSRARLVFWTVPILLLLLTLGLRQVLSDAIDRNATLVEASIRPTAAPTARPQPPAILQPELAVAGDAEVLAYLSALDAPRAQLREAVERYRAATSQPGGSSVAHAAAARELRDQLDAAHATIGALSPPAAIEPAHDAYLTGLEIERQALEDMLEFYNGFHVQYANRATLRMLDAERQFERARTLFAKQQSAAGGQRVPPQTAR